MRSRVMMLLAEVGIAALLMWFDSRIFWLYFFAACAAELFTIGAAIAANHLELAIHLETIQNRVGVVSGVDAAAVVQNLRENMSEKEWEQICETFKFARPSA